MLIKGCFHFLGILTIENLRHFTGLVKLQLNNNFIERIEGLDYLENLQWLGKYLFNYPRMLEGKSGVKAIGSLCLSVYIRQFVIEEQLDFK